MKILNGFSFNMVANFPATVRAEEISLEKAREIAARGLDSVVGHQDTAAVYGQQLGVVVPPVRSTVSLHGETALIGQYRGPRMPEGCKELPAGATIQWLLVTVS
jgi:hypothetical protein